MAAQYRPSGGYNVFDWQQRCENIAAAFFMPLRRAWLRSALLRCRCAPCVRCRLVCPSALRFAPRVAMRLTGLPAVPRIPWRLAALAPLAVDAPRGACPGSVSVWLPSAAGCAALRSLRSLMRSTSRHRPSLQHPVGLPWLPRLVLVAGGRPRPRRRPCPYGQPCGSPLIGMGWFSARYK